MAIYGHLVMACSNYVRHLYRRDYSTGRSKQSLLGKVEIVETYQNNRNKKTTTMEISKSCVGSDTTTLNNKHLDKKLNMQNIYITLKHNT